MSPHFAPPQKNVLSPSYFLLDTLAPHFLPSPQDLYFLPSPMPHFLQPHSPIFSSDSSSRSPSVPVFVRPFVRSSVHPYVPNLCLCNFWQLFATVGNHWQMLATFGSYLATFCSFWQLLVIFCNFLQFLATIGNYWQLLATFGN